MRKTSILALLLLPILWGCAQAGMKTSGDVVDVYAVPASMTAKAGERIEFDVKLDIQKNWHLYAHEDTLFIGVDLNPAQGCPLEKLVAEYPAGHEGEFFGEKVVMISGKNTIHVAAGVPAGLDAGEYVLDLSVTVQACDNKTCLAPADLPVKLKLTVE